VRLRAEQDRGALRRQVIGAPGYVGTKQSTAVLRRLSTSKDFFVRVAAERAYEQLRRRFGDKNGYRLSAD
jgi:hypothetical protein